MIRLILFALGSTSICAGLLLPEWRYPEMGYDPLSIPLAAAGLGLMVMGAVWSSRWRRCGALFFLLLLGQAAALQLVDAPRYAVYQHYLPWAALPGLSPWLLIIGLQAVVSGVLLSRAWRSDLFGTLGLGPLRLILAVGILAYAAAVPTVGLPRYLGEVLLSLAVALAAFSNVLVLALSAPAEALRTAEEWIASRVPLAPHHSDPGRWQGRFVPLLAAGVVVLTSTISWYVMEAVPHIGDAVSYLFQARYLAEGHLYLPSPPDSAAFEMSHVVNDGTRWYSKYFPGWPVVLSFGVRAGAPWLVNPVLAGLAVILCHVVLRRLYEPWLANAGVLLLAVSPWFLFMSSGMMGHSASLVWTLLAIWSMERERDSARGLWAAVVGLSLGALFLTRPLEGLLLAPVLALWARRGRDPAWGARSFATCTLAGAATGALVFPFNRALTGSATITPFSVWSERNYGPGADVLGFGPEVGIPDWDSVDPVPGHGLFDVILNTNKNLFVTNIELFGWGTGSLVLAVVALVWWRWKRPDHLFLWISAAVIFGHFLYWFPGGPDFGARYWYQALVPLIVLTLRGAVHLCDRLEGATGWKVCYRRVGLAVAATSLCAMWTFMPWRAWTKHYRYRDIGSEAAQLVATMSRPAVVFVSTDRLSDYESVFNLNTIDPANPALVVAWDRGPASREKVMGAYPDHAVAFLRRIDSIPRMVLDAAPD